MLEIINFSAKTIEELKFYVYVLINFKTKKICYVGKGQGQRIFQSLNERSLMLNVHLQGYIVRHGLNEDEAFLVEATLIDFLPYFSLATLSANLVEGKHSSEQGICSIEEIELRYSAPILTETDFQHNILVITINRSLKTMDSSLTEAEKLYEATRYAWRLNKQKAEKMDFVIAKYHGLVKAIYQVDEWYLTDEPKRYAFHGHLVTDPKINELYVGKQLKLETNKQGNANPITYVVKKDS